MGRLALGAAGNALAGAVAARAGASPGEALRATGNGTFVAFAAPFALRAGRAARGHWGVYVGAHCALVAPRGAVARRNGGSFSATSRYGGGLGYATIATLGATSYAPGGIPHADTTIRRAH